LSSRDYFLPGFIIAKFENLAFFFFFFFEVVLTLIERNRRHKFLRRSRQVPKQLDTFGELDLNRPNRTHASFRSEVFPSPFGPTKKSKPDLNWRARLSIAS